MTERAPGCPWVNVNAHIRCLQDRYHEKRSGRQSAPCSFFVPPSETSQQPCIQITGPDAVEIGQPSGLPVPVPDQRCQPVLCLPWKVQLIQKVLQLHGQRCQFDAVLDDLGLVHVGIWIDRHCLLPCRLVNHFCAASMPFLFTVSMQVVSKRVDFGNGKCYLGHCYFA